MICQNCGKRCKDWQEIIAHIEEAHDDAQQVSIRFER